MNRVSSAEKKWRSLVDLHAARRQIFRAKALSFDIADVVIPQVRLIPKTGCLERVVHHAAYLPIHHRRTGSADTADKDSHVAHTPSAHRLAFVRIAGHHATCHGNDRCPLEQGRDFIDLL